MMFAVATGAAPGAAGGLTVRSSTNPKIPHAAWLICSACGMGAFAVGTPDQPETLFPARSPFGTPQNLSPEVEHTWAEALDSFSASAFTACSLMCRKIIFHIAVEEGLPAKNARDRAPGFEECIDYLVNEGHITKKQKERWVDSIRIWGNMATHELAPTDRDTAYSALQFTKQLLEMIYAFPSAAPQTQKEITKPSDPPAITS